MAFARRRLQRACCCAGSRARAACWPLLAIARRHRSASTGLSRAAGIVSAGRDLQLVVCSSATSSVQLWRRTSREADRRSGPLSARRRALRPSPNPELGASAPSGSATQYSSPADTCAAPRSCTHSTQLHGHETAHGLKRRAPARRFHLPLTVGPPWHHEHP